MKETIEIDGYKVVVALDDYPANPFEDWDCNPPLMVFNYRDRSFITYGDVPDIWDLVGMIPDEQFARGKRVNLIKNLNCSLKEFADYRFRYSESVRDAFGSLCSEQAPKPTRYSNAEDYFDMVKWLCKIANVPCYYGTYNGHCQGDYALVMAFATPQWAKEVGLRDGGGEEACKSAYELYCSWAWGDVYGIVSIISPTGEEVRDSSVWGFYGDHEKSGLLDDARAIIEWHKKEVKDAEALQHLTSVPTVLQS
jgi:hypothetical protein